jgi:hypothetical protein
MAFGDFHAHAPKCPDWVDILTWEALAQMAQNIGLADGTTACSGGGSDLELAPRVGSLKQEGGLDDLGGDVWGQLLSFG